MKDYAELVLTAAKMSGDVDAANYASSLLAIAEKKLSRRLKARQQQRIKTLTTDTSGSIPLPRGFIEMVSVYKAKELLDAVPYEMIKSEHRRGYAIVGERVYMRDGSTAHQITYVEDIPSLEEEGSNWLLEAAPDIYLQALLYEIAVKNLEVDKAGVILTYLDRLIAQYTQHNKSTMITITGAGGQRP